MKSIDIKVHRASTFIHIKVIAHENKKVVLYTYADTHIVIKLNYSKIFIQFCFRCILKSIINNIVYNILYNLYNLKLINISIYFQYLLKYLKLSSTKFHKLELSTTIMLFLLLC